MPYHTLVEFHATHQRHAGRCTIRCLCDPDTLGELWNYLGCPSQAEPQWEVNPTASLSELLLLAAWPNGSPNLVRHLDQGP